MAHHAAGKRFPDATKGSEREILIREFLAKVLPPPFRFGTGAVIDCEGRRTGQMDIVVEFPILPSFPTPGSPERLYLADSVAFAIEVKSDLAAQWQQVEEKATQLSPLRRSWRGHIQMDFAGGVKQHDASDSRVPFVAIGFEGYATIDSLQRRLDTTSIDARPDSALVVSSGAYASRVRGSTPRAFGPAGLFALCTDAAYYARNVVTAVPDLSKYFAALNADAG